MYVLSEGLDPTISENIIKSYYGRSEKSQEIGLSLGKTKQRFAVGAHGFDLRTHTLKPKHDPKFFRFLAIQYT